MAAEDTSSPSNTGITQEFRQEQAAVTGRQPDKSGEQTQKPAQTQLEDRRPSHENYGPNHDLQQERGSHPESQVEQSASQLREPEATRPGKVRQPGYVQGQGDHVSESNAGRINNGMINQGKELPTSSRDVSETLVDQKASEIQARERSIAQNDQTKEKRINELAERFRTTENTQSPQKQQEQER